MNALAAIARPIRIDGDRAYVPLTQGYEAVINVEDVRKVEGRNWNAYIERRKDGSIKAVYGRSNVPRDGGGQRTILLHRVIVDAEGGTLVDHADTNGLNNLRSNLRVVTELQNARNARTRLDNTSGYKGVTWHNQRRKWKAQIWHGGKQRSLGLFISPEDAAAAYARASAEYHGEFGRTA